MQNQPNIRTLANALMRGTLTAEQLVSERLEVAAATTGVFTSMNEEVMEQARQIDRMRGEGKAPLLAGVPISLKDLFDIKGQRTLAGSRVLADKVDPACQDAEVVGYLRELGMLFVGRTNMSEFAFSGMGLNPHFPLLTSIWDSGRLPGGSSSGSAVSVAAGVVPGTLGSDTAGSCRIPAAFNGIVGVKPSFDRLSSQGVYPLSPTSDAPGPLGLDVDSCFLLDQGISGALKPSATQLPQLQLADPKSIRLLVPEGLVLQDLDEEVSEGFTKTINLLKATGVEIIQQPMPVIDDCANLFLKRPIAVYEAWKHHQSMIENHGEEYDPYVSIRIQNGKNVSDEEQARRYADKAILKQRFHEELKNLHIDGVIYPTVACVPPTVESTKDTNNIGAINLRCLRNTATANYFDGCSISLPYRAGVQSNDAAPVGIMISCGHGEDQKLYQIAASVEAIMNRNL